MSITLSHTSLTVSPDVRLLPHELGCLQTSFLRFLALVLSDGHYCCGCSYLGYGLMAGRAAVLAWEEARAANPCVPTDHSVSQPHHQFGTCIALLRCLNMGAGTIHSQALSIGLL